MLRLQRTFHFDRATKNTFLYKEDDHADGLVTGSLYIQKIQFGHTAPQSLTLTVEAVQS